MEKGVALQGYIPMKKEPSETSEMVSQVLFGEEFQLLDKNGRWRRISLDFDCFEGWVAIDSIHTFKAENKAGNHPNIGFKMVTHPYIIIQDLTLGHQLILPTGSILPKSDGVNFSLGAHDFEVLSGEGIIFPDLSIDPEEIGKGLISLPRQCNQQAGLGSNINFMHEIKQGDLAFFDNEAGELVHVGMALDGGKILHSSQNVRIDKLDQHGIYSLEKETYTHKLRVIKRLVS